MRLGGPVFGKHDDPDVWAAAVKAAGYRAAYCPVPLDADEATAKAYQAAAHRTDIVIAEVGAWSNPLSPDPTTRAEALDKCRRALAMADRVGARCCVNIVGSRGAKWDGPDAGDLTRETFDMIVERVRGIVDAVRPRRTFYTLETMPWMYPDSADHYLELLRAIDRKAVAAHLDPVNLVCSPQRYFATGELIRECFARLGPHIRSCHAKDIKLQDKLTVHLDEVCPGDGGLDYATYLRELGRLDPDTSLMIEHLKGEDEYRRAAEHIREVARKEGLTL